MLSRAVHVPDVRDSGPLGGRRIPSGSMHIPDSVVGPGGQPPASIGDADIAAMILDGEPVLVLLPRYAMATIAPDGKLVTGDALDSDMRARGARPLVGTDYTAIPSPGWLAVHDTAAETLRITRPDGAVAYDGTLSHHEQWNRLAAAVAQRTGGLVLITCSAATPQAALEMIEAGRALWLRVPAQLS